MKRLIYLLRRLRLSLLMTAPVFAISSHERREMIFDIQQHTFRHQDQELVRLVTAWAMSITEAGDDALVGMWEQSLERH